MTTGHPREPASASLPLYGAQFPHPSLSLGCQGFLNISGTVSQGDVADSHCRTDSLPGPSPVYLHSELPA